ncbi:lytic transglycosylase domain-containing protein [Actinocorallia sp. API 0066]|uniref:aggregation-promoting factor C-terminal-like domain-containing protein n=1 Tax=Actinocorallia sp. API 0066 TaxID=2896846 RepID=UPI001E614F22|nr:transglycosylase SLT domain-containing protein [Actinocorallia sp. API 0066]MCD0447885.1 lytic transglycosylase domain-containing protein [Actinocorallia sp. API 0066]
MSGHTSPQAPRHAYRGIVRKIAVVTASGVIFGLVAGLPAHAASAQRVVTAQAVAAAPGAAKTAQATAQKGKGKGKKLTRKQRNQAIAKKHVAKRKWSKSQFRCLVKLWNKESNWNHLAYNRSSGAGGIPQALPASKMASAGKDWRTNPETQIRWGLKYIKARYGTPCAAWSHAGATGWY